MLWFWSICGRQSLRCILNLINVSYLASSEIHNEDKIESNTRLAPIFASAALKIFVEENEEQMELANLSAHYPDEGPGTITYVLLVGDQSLFGFVLDFLL